jgi:carboxylesterase
MPDRRAAFSAPGGTTGALILHGFTGTPASMRPLADALASAGYAVELPLLPGHGTTPLDLATRRFADFAAAVGESFSILSSRCDAVVVIGLSMGGSLALDLATRHDELAGVVVINPFAEPAAPSFPALLRAALAAGSEFIPSIGSDVARGGAEGGGYDSTPIAPMLSLVEAIIDLSSRLSSISVPVLLFSSRIDHVVPPSNGDYLATHICAPLERIMLEKSFHVATLDYDADLIAQATVDFMKKVVVPL